MPRVEGLTEKQKRFVREYLACGNATKAAERAGYALPNKIAAKLVKIGVVADAIAAGAKSQEVAACLSREDRLALLSRMATGEEMESVTDASGGVSERPAPIRARIAALELIAKMCGDLTEKREVIHKGDAALRVKVAGMSAAEVREELRRVRERNGG